MSTMPPPEVDVAEPPIEPRRTICSRCVSKVKTVLSRGAGSRRHPLPTRTPMESTALPSSAPSAPPVEDPATAIVEVSSALPPVPSSTPLPAPRPTMILRSQIDAERARKLGERFNLNFDTYEWSSPHIPVEVYRIERPIRMRIHRTCHRCGVTFGLNKICVSCQHTRCVKCPRYPTAKPRSKGHPGAGGGPAGGIEPDDYYGLGERLVLTKPSKTGGQPLVRKLPVQRVRRTCHRCSSLFHSGSKTCSSCGHSRCADCPRDPPKRKKYPDGYPGDRPAATPPAPAAYDCHLCKNAFPVMHPSIPGDSAAAQPNTAEAPCIRCGHLRCAACPKSEPASLEADKVPEAMKTVEAKLHTLSVKSSFT